MQIEETHAYAEIVKRRCYECGGQMEGRRGSDYHYTECGLQRVQLRNILVFNCKNPECGAVTPEIPNVSELHRVIALSIIEKNTLLTAEEIKFLRRMANLSGVELAAMIGIHKTALSRWENGARNISKKSDVALRLLCFAAIAQERLRNNEFLPHVVRATKTLSEIDLKAVLQRVQEIMRGSKVVSIDPKHLLDGGFAEEDLTGRELSTTVQ